MWELNTLLTRGTNIDTLFVHSHDMSLYTLEAQLGEDRRPLAENGRVLSFRSIEHARQHLSTLKVARCMLVQASAYQEMCGQAPAAPPMELEMSWPGWQAQ